MKLTTGVIIINILRAAFVVVFFFWRKNIGEKAACKMLVTPDIDMNETFYNASTFIRVVKLARTVSNCTTI